MAEIAKHDMYGYRFFGPNIKNRVIVRAGHPIPPDLQDLESADLRFGMPITDAALADRSAEQEAGLATLTPENDAERLTANRRAANMNKTELQAELGRLGLGTDGTRQELIDRLNQAREVNPRPNPEA